MSRGQNGAYACVLILGALALGCTKQPPFPNQSTQQNHQGGSTAAPAATQLASSSGGAAATGSDTDGLQGSVEVPGCSPGAGLVLTEVVPEDTRLAIWLDLTNAELAREMAALATKLDERPDLGLPILVDLNLRQLGYQYAHVRQMITPLGMAPSELLWLHRKDGSSLWLWQARCDLADVQTAAQTRWNLRTRSTVEGVVMEPMRSLSGVVADDPFPHDIVGLPGDRWLLTPAQAGTASARWLLEGSPAIEAAGDQPKLGELLAKRSKHAGPIQVAASATGLLTGSADAKVGTAIVLGVDAGRVEFLHQ